MRVIRCISIRRKEPSRYCGAFLTRAPDSAVVAGIVGHSKEAEDGSWVVRCASCGTLHEIRDEREAAA